MDYKLINISKIINKSFCVDIDDAEIIFKQLKFILENKKSAKLSFENIDLVTLAFLNVAVGKLYNEFDESLIQSSLNVENMDDNDKVLLKRVTDNAKVYYKDPERMNKSIQDILGDE